MLAFLRTRRATPATALALVSVLPLAGCGARSTLDAGPGASGTARPEVACEAAVEAGAPSPMIGYCSTRAFRSAFEAPSAPHVTWTASLGQGARAEATTSDAQGVGVVSLLSLADGSIQWSTSTGAQVSDWFAIDRDGAVAVVSGYTGATGKSTLTAIEPGGAIRWQHVSQEHVLLGGTIDASGALLLTSTNGDNFAVDMATGETRWTLPAPSPNCPFPLTVSTGRLVYGMQCDGTVYAATSGSPPLRPPKVPSRGSTPHRKRAVRPNFTRRKTLPTRVTT